MPRLRLGARTVSQDYSKTKPWRQKTILRRSLGVVEATQDNIEASLGAEAIPRRSLGVVEAAQDNIEASLGAKNGEALA